MRLIRHPMTTHILLYGIVLAGFALLLGWMDFHHVMHRWSTEVYVLCVALLFATLGIWLGSRLVPRKYGFAFRLNTEALAELGISARELEVLGHLAAGASNKLIARRLSISPNTVKSHVARLFGKLEAKTRTEAVAKARSLDLLP